MTPDNSAPSLVLIHGGAHNARCWDLVIDEINDRAPYLRVLAVDLPGRRTSPAPPATSYADAVIAEIERAGLGCVVVAAHSLGGLTALRVVTKLGYPKVREVILVAAVTPPHGSSVVDTLPWPFAHFLRRTAMKAEASLRVPPAAGRALLWNGVPRHRGRYARTRLCREPAQILLEPADHAGLPRETKRTWILTRRDRVVSQRRQLTYISGLGGIDTVLTLDTCHDVMYSEPSWLAQVFIERCRHQTADDS